MSSLHFARDLSSMIFICAAVFALFTQQRIIMLHTSFKFRKLPDINKIHRWLGWVAIAGLISYMAFNLTITKTPVNNFDLVTLLHIPLLTICAVMYLRKVWKTHPIPNLRLIQLSRHGVAFLVLGTSFFLISISLAMWRVSTPYPIWDKNVWPYYQISSLAHVGLAILLIWLGRLVLRKVRSS